MWLIKSRGALKRAFYVPLLKWEIPMQSQARCSYLMNQGTFVLLMTISDANSTPLWTTPPGAEPGFTLAGSPIRKSPDA